MKQLNIQDAGFIYNETRNTPMHICGLGIYDRSGSNNIYSSLDDTLRYINGRLHLAPIMGQKLEYLSKLWDRPYWVDDENFALENHVQIRALPKPGNISQLHELVSAIVAEPLDMSRPLWEVYVIDGLHEVEGGSRNCFAVLTKIHHACVDGASGNNILAVLHDLEANPKPPAADDATAADPTTARTKKPGRYLRKLRAYTRNGIEIVEQTNASCRRIPKLSKTAYKLYRGKIDAGVKLNVPKTRFNRTPDIDRVFSTVEFNLPDIKALKNAVPNITVNDVMLCIVAGGLRRYLAEHKELPETSLGAVLPQNVRTEQTANETCGNQVGGLFASLHTDIGDPVERLLAIHDSTQKAKAFAKEADTAAIFKNLMGGFLYPSVGSTVAKATQKFGLMEKMGPFVVNTFVTNVPGPNFPIYHNGARLLHFSGIPPLTDGIALAHAVYSFNNIVSLSVLSCPALLKDVDFYIDCLETAYKELRQTMLAESEQPAETTEPKETAESGKQEQEQELEGLPQAVNA